MTDSPDQRGTRDRTVPVKLLAIIALAAGAAVLYANFGHLLTLEYLAGREADLRRIQASQPVLVYGAAFGIYVLVAGLSLPGAAVLTLVYSWYFGFSRALLLVSFASTAGATVAFLLSRFFFSDAIRAKFGQKLKDFDDSLRKDGPFFLFTLRLIPAVPFFVINAVMGLTPVPARTFWWVSQLGMLPGTAVYVYAGSSVPDLQTLADKGVFAVLSADQLFRITIAFVLLGSFPLLVRMLLKKLRPAAASPETTTAFKTSTNPETSGTGTPAGSENGVASTTPSES